MYSVPRELTVCWNYSWSAEHGNVEFGVLIDDRNLTEAVERELRDAEPLLYEQVPATGI